MEKQIKCSCGGLFNYVIGPTHEYIESVPGCWAVYCEILGKEYSSFDQLKETHRLTVDTYAVQHPGNPGRKSTQSVWGHLIAMYYMIELNTGEARALSILKKFINNKLELNWLKPPDFEGTMTVSDVITAKDIHEHNVLVKKWADSVWDRWYSVYKNEISKMIINMKD